MSNGRCIICHESKSVPIGDPPSCCRFRTEWLFIVTEDLEVYTQITVRGFTWTLVKKGTNLKLKWGKGLICVFFLALLGSCRLPVSF